MKAYAVVNIWDDDFGTICVIADTQNEAKSLAIKDERLSDGMYIDLRATVCKNADIEGLNKGVFDHETELMTRGMFHCCYMMDCPKCGTKETTVNYDNDAGFSCEFCEE